MALPEGRAFCMGTEKKGEEKRNLTEEGRKVFRCNFSLTAVMFGSTIKMTAYAV